MTDSDAFFTRKQALDRGLSDAQIHRRVTAGGLTRISRGALADSDRWAELAAHEKYRSVVRAAVNRGTNGAAVSHQSAAMLHLLPVLRPDFESVHFTLDGKRGGHGGSRVLHRVTLDPVDVTCVDGIMVTTVARTAIDVACAGTFEQAVCAIESALRAKVTRNEMADALSRVGRRRGIAIARRALDFADGRTESIGESWSRALMIGWSDIPEPRLQHEFRTPEGYFIARTDFDWDGRLVGEFDGMVKYGKNDSEAVLDERRREILLQDQGIQVVRWKWGDLRRPDLLYRKLRAALDRVGL